MTSKTRMDWHKDLVTGDLHFSGVLDHRDLVDARFSAVDRRVLEDCFGENRTAADWILALELTFRRIEEARRERAAVETGRQGP